MLSGMPFEGPIGAVRLAYNQEGSWVPHPTYEEGDAATFELVVAGRQLGDGDVAIMMVEAGGSERAWEYYQAGAPKVTEEVIADGLEAAKTWIKESIALQRQLIAEAGARETAPFTAMLDYGDDVFAAVAEGATPLLAKAITIASKTDRNEAVDSAVATTVDTLAGSRDDPGPFAGREKEIRESVRALT